MEHQLGDGVDRSESLLVTSQSQAEQQPEASRDASPKEAPSAQDIQEKPSQLLDVAKAALKSTPQHRSTPTLGTRPPHSGWEPTTINMAKCDYCDKRRRGTLHRCVQCQIAICKTCCASGILDHDSRHSLDIDAVDWELHPKERAEKKPRKAAATATRGGGRFKTRGVRSKKAELLRAATDEVEVPGRAQPQDEIVVAALSVAEQQELGEQTEVSFGSFVPHRSASAQEDSGLQPIGCREVTQDPSVNTSCQTFPGPAHSAQQHQAHGQLPASYTETRQPPVARSQYTDSPTGVRHLPQAMSTPHQEAGCSTPSCASPAPRLIQARANQYQPEDADASAPLVYRNQGHGGSNYAGTYETYLANRERVFGPHPFRAPYSEEIPSSRYEYHMSRASATEQQEGNRYGHRYALHNSLPTGPDQAYDQERFPPGSIVDSGINSHSPTWNPQIPHHHQPAPFHPNRISLPPIRELEKPPLSLHQSQPHNHHPQPGLLPPEPLIHRLGSQLESDALATHQDFSAWPLDECLRHEVARVWSRRNAPAGLLRELLPSGGSEVGVDESFRVLLGATYFAAIRLRLDIQNAARRWLVETEKQLCADKLMEPVRANFPLGRHQ